MGRHVAAAGPPDESRTDRWRRLAVRAAEALVLGSAAGVGAWAASTWVGTTRAIAAWIGLAAGVLAAAATWAGAGPAGPPTTSDDEDGPRAI